MSQNLPVNQFEEEISNGEMNEASVCYFADNIEEKTHYLNLLNDDTMRIIKQKPSRSEIKIKQKRTPNHLPKEKQLLLSNKYANHSLIASILSLVSSVVLTHFIIQLKYGIFINIVVSAFFFIVFFFMTWSSLKEYKRLDYISKKAKSKTIFSRVIHWITGAYLLLLLLVGLLLLLAVIMYSGF